MHLFYTPDISAEQYVLSEPESKHAVKVLRLKEGDTIQLMDGQGSFFKAEIIDAHPKRCSVQVVKKEKHEPRPYKIHIAIAPTKNIDRLEWFLEKCTEMGIDRITPIICEHSERKVIKHDRLFKVIISACKQSLQAYVPILEPLTKVDHLIKEAADTDRCIAHCEEHDKLSLKQLSANSNDLLILIGPEGDFSIREIELAKLHGFKPVSLGKSRLRTETAGIAACHTVHVVKE